MTGRLVRILTPGHGALVDVDPEEFGGCGDDLEIAVFDEVHTIGEPTRRPVVVDHVSRIAPTVERVQEPSVHPAVQAAGLVAIRCAR